MKKIECGYYTDLSIEDYHNSEGLSKSGIAKILKSPRHYWHEYFNPDKETKKRSDDFVIGDMVHTKLLEPDKLEERFCLSPLTDRRTKQGKEDYADFLMESAGKTPCTMEMSCQVNCMEESAKSNKEFMSLIEGGAFESSIYFKDVETDLLLKSRPDILFDSHVADLKTTRDASPESFQRDCIAYGYDIQFALMQQATYAQFGKMIKEFFILCIEKEPPYATAVYLMSDDMIHYGRKRLREGLKKYNEIKDMKIQEITYDTKVLELPAWCKL